MSDISEKTPERFEPYIAQRGVPRMNRSIVGHWIRLSDYENCRDQALSDFKERLLEEEVVEIFARVFWPSFNVSGDRARARKALEAVLDHLAAREEEQ